MVDRHDDAAGSPEKRKISRWRRKMKSADGGKVGLKNEARQWRYLPCRNGAMGMQLWRVRSTHCSKERSKKRKPVKRGNSGRRKS